MTNRFSNKERIVSRRGLRINILFDFFIKFYGLMIFSEMIRIALEPIKAGTMFKTIELGLMPAPHAIGMTTMYLGLIAIAASCAIDNLIINKTLIDYEKSKTYIAIRTFIATVATLIVFSALFGYLGTQSFSFVNVIAIGLAFALISAKVSIGIFDLGALLVVNCVNLVAHFQQYGLYINSGKTLDVFIITTATFVLATIIMYLNNRYFVESFTKKWLQRPTVSGFFKMFFHPLVVVATHVLTYMLIYYFFQTLGILTITSLKELLIVIAINWLYQFSFNFHFSQVHTNTNTFTRSYY